MRRNISNNLLLLISICALLSCKAKKEIVKAVPVSATESNKASRLQAIGNSTLKYSTLSIKAKADLDIDGNKNDATMNIRIQNGKAIWVSVTALAGLEIARALITPDSVKILNRLESTYTKKPFNYLYRYANRQINFGTVEDVFAGNPLKEGVSPRSDLSIQGSQASLSGILESLIYNIRFNEMNKVVQTSLKDEGAAQSLLVNYGNFIGKETQIIPHLVSIKSQAERKNVVIDLQYSRVELDQTLEMPFTVPRRFTVKN